MCAERCDSGLGCIPYTCYMGIRFDVLLSLCLAIRPGGWSINLWQR